ncbi:MAG: acetylornithine deacetylase/succinyl-diaminopimelate desuccinylase family protein [Vicinamibacterales bacterium]
MSDRVLAEVDRAAGELVELAAGLVRIPTVNPPGEEYDACARAIGVALEQALFEVEYFAAEGRPEHTATHPRINVVGARAGAGGGPTIHLNGHFDVVPAGAGWTMDPFGGVVRDGRLYGRGSCDMKGGIASAVFAAEAIRRAGVTLPGTVEISGTVDEESGGYAGVAWLAEHGRIAKGRTDYVIIPEPLNVDRVCVGHRGVYWFEVTVRGRVAHGSMPFLGVSAIDAAGELLHEFTTALRPELAARTTAIPVVPEGSRHATINVNAVAGGQPVGGIQTPNVADLCRIVVDRRFLEEEGLERTRREIEDVISRVRARFAGAHFEVTDLMIVEPTHTPDGSPLVAALSAGLERVLGRPAAIVASPGTYDQKHVARIAGVPHCVAYGPGEIEQAHQPDEWCGVDDMVTAAKVMALAILRLNGIS